jgi:hypothetical protein
MFSVSLRLLFRSTKWMRSGIQLLWSLAPSSFILALLVSPSGTVSHTLSCFPGSVPYLIQMLSRWVILHKLVITRVVKKLFFIRSSWFCSSDKVFLRVEVMKLFVMQLFLHPVLLPEYLSCDTDWWCNWIPAFRRNMQPSTSGEETVDLYRELGMKAVNHKTTRYQNPGSYSRN